MPDHGHRARQPIGNDDRTEERVRDEPGLRRLQRGDCHTVALGIEPPAGGSQTLTVDRLNALEASLAITRQATPLDSVVSTTEAHAPPHAMTSRVTVLPRVELVEDEPQFVPGVLERYETLQKLGEGGVGEVTLARDNDIQRPVAIKRIRSEMVGSGTLARFVEEIRTVGQLDHPNIVPIHDVGVDNEGRYFFVMKYVDAETLESVIGKLAAGDRQYHRRFTWQRRLQVFTGILRAIQYAHAQGIIHRDIKPANIMVGQYGEVMVMDWGVAKQIRKPVLSIVPPPPVAGPVGASKPTGISGNNRELFFQTRHGTLIGTPAYMSPEQASGATEAIDERSDVYSLCVLLHEFLTLEHYLADKTTLEGILAGVKAQSPPFNTMVGSLYQRDVPPELLHFLRRGLAKVPSERYHSTTEMLELLQDITDGRISVECAFTLMKRTSSEYMRLVDRRPLVALTFTVVMVGLLAYNLVSIVLHMM